VLPEQLGVEHDVPDFMRQRKTVPTGPVLVGKQINRDLLQISRCEAVKAVNIFQAGQRDDVHLELELHHPLDGDRNLPAGMMLLKELLRPGTDLLVA